MCENIIPVWKRDSVWFWG